MSRQGPGADRLEGVSNAQPNPVNAGRFIVFEGGDGAGKSTQAALLVQVLRQNGHTVLHTREPGGTPIGEKLRSLVLDHGQGTVDARTEALMYAAARAAHVEQVIRPALAAGTMVICDRYVDSSLAYQGIGRSRRTVGADGKPLAEDRLESEPDEFHSRIRDAFVHFAAREPSRYLVLDAATGVQSLAAVITEAVAARLNGPGA
jgi:dTMP kinase